MNHALAAASRAVACLTLLAGTTACDKVKPPIPSVSKPASASDAVPAIPKLQASMPS